MTTKIMAMWLLVCVLSTNCFCQAQRAITDTVAKKRPPHCGTDVAWFDVVIDTLHKDKFSAEIHTLYKKVVAAKSLNKGEERTLLLLMNTLSWASYDKQEGLQTRFPELTTISHLFNIKYLAVLDSKYTVCSAGSSLYYQELGICYLGNPSNCSRYFVQ